MKKTEQRQTTKLRYKKPTISSVVVYKSSKCILTDLVLKTHEEVQGIEGGKAE